MSGCSDNSNHKTPVITDVYIETGDLDALTQRGTIRLLRLRREENTGLPRQGMPQSEYQHSIENFVQQLGLKTQWLEVDTYSELFSALHSGAGDMIVTNLTQTPSREKTLAFSLPIARAQELIITANSTDPIESIEALQGKRIAIQAGSSYQDSLLDLLENNIELNFDIVILGPEDNSDTLLDRLNNKDFDAAVIDSNLLEAIGSYRQDFTIGTHINEVQNIAWAMRPSNPDLLHKLNIFVLETLSKKDWDKRYFDDWDKIVERKYLRVITRNNPTSYFLWRGELMGFDYELIRHFADQHKLKLEMVVAPPKADLIDWLQEGRGDLIAASMTVSADRQKRGVAFSQAYNQVAEQLVSGKGSAPLQQLSDLNGRTLVINPNTHYWNTAKNLQQQGYDFTLQALDQGLSSTELLQAVARGDFDATISDSHLIDIEDRFVEDLIQGLELQPRYDHGWAVRADDSQLLETLNKYLQKQDGSKHFNVVKQKYFSDDNKIEKYQGQRLEKDGQLSPFDQMVQSAATPEQFDWRLITAQMYQESRFNPRARSHVGARGLMQVMPRTARDLGYKLPFSEESGIAAGVAYLAWSRDRFEETLPPQERIWFSLAAYNAGSGHVYDARRLAEQQGWNPDIWFDNVEKAMLLLSKRKYHSKARFGYVRGSEPVNYVRKIRKRYQAYLDL